MTLNTLPPTTVDDSTAAVKPQILLIHGMWGGSWYWQPMREYLEQRGYRCIVPTLRYHDRAPGEPPPAELGRLSLQVYVDDMAALIHTLPSKPVVMGHSMGGLIAQKLAEQGLARALVLACPAPPADVPAISWSAIRCFLPLLLKPCFWRRPLRPSFRTAVYSSLQLIPVAQRRSYYERLVHDSGWALVEIALPFLDRAGASRVRTEQVNCPLLVLAAGDDRLIPARVVKKVADKYPQADYQCFSGQTHWLIAEPGWQDCAEAVHRWLCKQPLDGEP